MSPKARLSEAHLMDLYLRRAIAASSEFYRASPEVMAQTAGVARATWYRRVAKPETFTVKELRNLIRAYRWDENTVCDFLGVRRDGTWHV